MGKKPDEKSLRPTLIESYSGFASNETRFLHFILPAEPISDGPALLSTGQCSVQPACEFSDFCNHMYYIEDRCSCAKTWRRTPGLVLPASW
jgi:hypothetical protein